LLLYKLLTNNTPAPCSEPPNIEAAGSSQARGPLPDLSYDDSQFAAIAVVVYFNWLCFSLLCLDFT